MKEVRALYKTKYNKEYVTQVLNNLGQKNEVQKQEQGWTTDFRLHLGRNMDYSIRAYLHACDEGIKIYIPEKRVGLRLDFINVIGGIIFSILGIYELQQYYDSGIKIALWYCFLFLFGATIMFLGVGNPENSKAFGQKLDKKIIEFMYRLFGPGSYYRDRNVKIETNYIQSDMIRENQAIDFTRLLPVMVSNVGDDFFYVKIINKGYRGYTTHIITKNEFNTYDDWKDDATVIDKMKKRPVLWCKGYDYISEINILSAREEFYRYGLGYIRDYLVSLKMNQGYINELEQVIRDWDSNHKASMCQYRNLSALSIPDAEVKGIMQECYSFSYYMTYYYTTIMDKTIGK